MHSTEKEKGETEDCRCLNIHARAVSTTKPVANLPELSLATAGELRERCRGMARLIDANALLEKVQFRLPIDNQNAEVIAGCVDITRRLIENSPTVDAVSRGVHDQVRWERDVAFEQLESYGVSFGEKAEVAKVVHGRWEDEYGGKYANPRYRCSVCKGKALYKMEQDVLLSWHEVQALTPICPYCMAKLDGGKDDDT